MVKQKNFERHMSHIPFPAKLTLFCCISFPLRAEFRIFTAHNNTDTRDARDTKFCEMLVRGERNSNGNNEHRMKPDEANSTASNELNRLSYRQHY